MKRTVTIFVASTALAAAIAAPGWGAKRADGDLPQRSANQTNSDPQNLVTLAERDDDDDDRDRHRRGGRQGHDDADDDGCDDDDDCAGGPNRGNATPAGAVAPPANGLFGNGAPPSVRVN